MKYVLSCFLLVTGCTVIFVEDSDNSSVTVDKGSGEIKIKASGAYPTGEGLPKRR